MAYQIVLTPAAQRDLGALPKKVLRRVDRRILGLGDEPRPRGAEKLRGGEGLLRLRVADDRIIFRVDDEARLIEVARMGHRREIYRRLC